MQIAFVAVSAGVAGDLHALGHVLFPNPNHRSQTSLVGRVSRFDHWNRDNYVHGEYRCGGLFYKLGLLSCYFILKINFVTRIKKKKRI